MFKNLMKCGVPSAENIESVLPDVERRGEKGYVIVECFQEIPCDPCVAACPKGAISAMSNINERPQTDLELCDGCGLCIGLCPGLAIFAIDETKDGYSILKIPHEFNSPEKGEFVTALDREGNPIARVEVERVIRHKSRTNVIWLKITDKNLLTKIRAIDYGLPKRQESQEEIE